MASADLSGRVEKVVACPPLSEMGDLQRREFHEALLDANSFEDLPSKWQAAIVEVEGNGPRLREVGGGESVGSLATRDGAARVRGPGRSRPSRRETLSGPEYVVKGTSRTTPNGEPIGHAMTTGDVGGRHGVDVDGWLGP
jgi:hypothetical protein